MSGAEDVRGQGRRVVESRINSDTNSDWEDEDGDGGNSNVGGSGLNAEMETEALEPLEMKFKHTEYEKVIKMQGRCFLKEAVDHINDILDDEEKKWFHEHPQFKHFFHMHLEETHKLMGMWMLFLHTACTIRQREAWFIINGVPIRYSIKEHGIISGLYCHNYPLDWEKKGGLGYVTKHFGKGTTISHEAIEEKFLGMGKCKDRLQMAILYFLSSVIVGQSKRGEKGTHKGAKGVHPFFLRAVNSRWLCETFPWGRLSFDDNLKQMKNLFRSFNGVVDKKGWCYPSFHIPLQFLAFEAIKVLGLKFREPFQGHVVPHGTSCPRMCTTKFVKCGMKGFPLSDLYRTLGTSQDIQSILVTTPAEASLCEKLFDEEEDIRDEPDYIVESWEKRLLIDEKPVILSTSFDIDVNGPKHKLCLSNDSFMLSSDEVSNLKKGLNDLQSGMKSLASDMEERFERMMGKIAEQGSRLQVVEGILKDKAGKDKAGTAMVSKVGGEEPKAGDGRDDDSSEEEESSEEEGGQQKVGEQKGGSVDESDSSEETDSDEEEEEGQKSVGEKKEDKKMEGEKKEDKKKEDKKKEGEKEDSSEEESSDEEEEDQQKVGEQKDGSGSDESGSDEEEEEKKSADDEQKKSDVDEEEDESESDGAGDAGKGKGDARGKVGKGKEKEVIGKGKKEAGKGKGKMQGTSGKGKKTETAEAEDKDIGKGKKAKKTVIDEAVGEKRKRMPSRQCKSTYSTMPAKKTKTGSKP